MQPPLYSYERTTFNGADVRDIVYHATMRGGNFLLYERKRETPAGFERLCVESRETAIN